MTYLANAVVWITGASVKRLVVGRKRRAHWRATGVEPATSSLGRFRWERGTAYDFMWMV